MHRNRTTFLIVLLVQAAIGHAQVPAGDAGILGIRGPVKECEEKLVTYVKRGTAWQPGLSYTSFRAVFDSLGRYLEITRYNKYNGILSERVSYAYGETGKISRTETATCDFQGKPQSRTVALFDGQGNKVEETETSDPGGLTLKRWVRKTGDVGTTIEYRQYSGGGSASYGEDTASDTSGKVLKSEKWWTGGDRYEWVFAYDADGRLSAARFYRKTGGVDLAWQYAYQDAGRPASIRNLRSDGSPLAERAYSYSPDGTLGEESTAFFSKTGEKTGSFRHVYDGKGRVIRETYAHAVQGFTTEWSYEYDAAGRLVGQTRTDTAGRPFEEWRSGYEDSGAKAFEARAVKGLQEGNRIVNAYDADHRLTSSTSYGQDGRIVSRSVRVYNPQGDLQDDLALNPDGSLQTGWSYDYVYDGRGNWISRIKLYADNAQEEYASIREKTARTLAYY